MITITYQVSNIVWFDDDDKAAAAEISIRFSSCNQPRDQWDDRDAIIDYLFDKFGEDPMHFDFQRSTITKSIEQ